MEQLDLFGGATKIKPKEKPAWQMTQEEWRHSERGRTAGIPQKLHVLEAIERGKPVPAEVIASFPDLRTPEGLQAALDRIHSIDRKPVEQPEPSWAGKSAEEMTQAEFMDSNLVHLDASYGRTPAFWRRYHQQRIADALKRGIPVPEAVLADYPDLMASPEALGAIAETRVIPEDPENQDAEPDSGQSSIVVDKGNYHRQNLPYVSQPCHNIVDGGRSENYGKVQPMQGVGFTCRRVCERPLWVACEEWREFCTPKKRGARNQ
jgi:hypothetical protein